MFAYLLQTLICHSMYSLIYTCIILLEYILYCIIYIYQLYSRMLLGSKIPNIFLVIHQHLHHQNFGLLYKMTNTVSLKFYRAKASWLLNAGSGEPPSIIEFGIVLMMHEWVGRSGHLKNFYCPKSLGTSWDEEIWKKKFVYHA